MQWQLKWRHADVDPAVPAQRRAGGPVFHVKPGMHEEIQKLFNAQFGEHFALLGIEQLEKQELPGSGKLSARARTFFGDLIGDTPSPNTMRFFDPQYPPMVHRGVHAGLAPGEMRIPLIVA